jgi:Ca-activated chloride channel family protein
MNPPLPPASSIPSQTAQSTGSGTIGHLHIETASTNRPRRLGELLGFAGRRREPKPFPLVRVVVRAKLVGDCAVTELEEHYENPYRSPLDVVHTIPLPADGAVTAFELRAGERCVRGRCKPRTEARADFESAKARGKTAAIIESERDDLHTISLANVPRGKSVVVKLTIVERLRVDDGRFEYRFPTTISEKYVPGVERSHEGHGVSGDTDRAPDASRLTPPVRLDGSTELDLEIELPGDSTDISASIPFARTNPGASTIVLRPTCGVSCSRDIVLRSWTRREQPAVRAYSDGTRTLVVVDPPASRRPELETPRDAVFVLDRSGSMDGARLEAAKRALVAALHTLTPKDSFEIIAFDNRLSHFSSVPMPASGENISRAMQFLDRIQAEGGTEALPALEIACRARVAPGRVRTVLFLTDGDVANDEELLALSRRLDPATRLFAIGIGVAPSASLLSRLARLCGGTHLHLEDSDDIEAEIRRFDATLAGPMAFGLGERGARRPTGGDLFAGRSAILFLDGHREQVEIESGDGRFRGSCAVSPSPIALGALWARDRVQTLEDRRISHPKDAALIDDEIASLGISHQIQTRLTSFVAVDEASQEEGEPVEVVQPVDEVADHEVYCCAMEERCDLVCHEFAPRASRSPASRNHDLDDELRIFRTSSGGLLASVRDHEWTSPGQWSLNRATAVFLALCLLDVPSDDPRCSAVEAAILARVGNDAAHVLAELRAAADDGDSERALSLAFRIAGVRTARQLLAS